jgi:CTP synthase (UTP-ammonia lyase)
MKKTNQVRTDQDGEIWIIEYPKNRFFISTLFVPQTNSSATKTHPLIERFVIECAK